MKNNGVEKVGNSMKLTGQIVLLGLVLIYLINFLIKPNYNDFKHYDGDMEKWERGVNQLVDDAVEDIEDGVWDDSEYGDGWRKKCILMTNYYTYEIGDVEMGKKVVNLFIKKLDNLSSEYPNIPNVREKVSVRLGLQFAKNGETVGF